ncbi:MAG: Eco57I restriction-modification methylase domain-containing protein, partial [Candidatus Methanospirareceae archaeon]
MSMDRDQAKQKIGELVKEYTDFEKTRSRKDMDSTSEANVRADFIDPLFEILGWDISNPDEYDREHFIRGTGFADVALKLEDAPVIFIEANRFGGIPHIMERGDGDWTMEERQAILYAARSNCKWAILTNFERFRVFNAATGLTILNFEMVYDYLNRFSELLYLTKDSVESGRIEKLAEREEKPDIDLEFLGLLNRWRVTLANDIYANNFLNEGKPITIDQIIPPEDLAIHPARDSRRMAEWIEKRRKKLEEEVDFAILKDELGNFDVGKLKSAVQRTLDRLIIVRWAEDNLITDDPNILSQKLRDWKMTPAYNSIVDLLFADRALFDKFNDIHNGRIFERGHICEKVKISDEVLGGIIEDMSKRSFRKFDFDILGNTYETYLGHTLHPKEDGTFELKPSQEMRKESGIYYTPPYVVDYIVKNTLGAILREKTPDEVAKIKVLDPACGSGSFLIKTFDYFSDYYRKENERIRAEKEQRVKEYLKLSGNQLSLDFENGVSDEYLDVEYGILVNNLHGVDLDEQACEIAAVNLMLKGLRAGGRMPLVLGEAIKTGNSLISGGAELSEYFGEGWRAKKPFNWEEEFGVEGFDVVVGNPPYVTYSRVTGSKGMGKSFEKSFTRYLREKYPNSAEYKLSTYVIFMNQAMNLLNNNGLFGFIIPDSFLLGRYFSKIRRYILDTTKIREIVLFLEDFWTHGTVGRSVIIILEREPDEILRRKNEVVVRLCPMLADLEKGNFKSNSYSQEYFEKTLHNRFRLFFDGQSMDFVNKMDKNVIKMGDIVSIHTGVRSKIGQKNIVSTEKKDETWKAGLISGGEVRRYVLMRSGHFINIEPSVLWSGGYDPDIVFKDKLLLRKTGDSLIATLDDKGYYHLDNLHAIILKNEEYNLKYILAIIDSKLMNHYYHLISLELGRAMAQTDIETIEQLPIAPATTEEQQPLIELVDRMIPLHKQLHEINTDFDRYLNLHPRIKDATLKEYIDALPITDKEVLKDHYGKPSSKIEGKIKEFEIRENGVWLV